MPRLVERLSQKKIHRLVKETRPKRHADGNGLYLQTPELSWVSLFRFQKKRHEMGLGPMHQVSLEEARARNADIRRLLAEGTNPLFQRAARRAKAAASRTFKEAAAAYIECTAAERKNPKHNDQWVMTLLGETGKPDGQGQPIKSQLNYCRAIHDVSVRDITHDMVLDVLRPIWETKHETATRLRGRIERVLGWAVAQGMAGSIDPNTYLNPARWNGPLKHALTLKSEDETKHHAALHYGEAPAFYAHLTEREGLAACAFRFNMLTATRTGDLFGSNREERPPMNWAHVDLETKVWTIPKTKNGAEHRVPLSDVAVDLLKQIRSDYLIDPGGIVFVGEAPNTALSNGAMLRVRDRMVETSLIKPGTVTPHGMSRSTFKSWASEETNFERDVVEACLSHTISDELESAYRRTDFLKKRTRLMQAWADYLTGKAVDKVVTLTAKSA
jgi:integrase